MTDWHLKWSEFMKRNPPGTEIEVLREGKWRPARVGTDNSTIYFEMGYIPIRFPGQDGHNQSRAFPSSVRSVDVVSRLADLANE